MALPLDDGHLLSAKPTPPSIKDTLNFLYRGLLMMFNLRIYSSLRVHDESSDSVSHVYHVSSIIK